MKESMALELNSAFPNICLLFGRLLAEVGQPKLKLFHATAAVLQRLHLLLRNRKINASVVPGAYNLNATITTC
jgi:hypothetical protein